MLDKSERVVIAKCIDVKTERVEKYGNSLFTFARFKVVDVITGSIVNEFTLRQFGGREGNTVIGSAIDYPFVKGEKLLLFLGGNNDDGYPLMFPQGVYKIVASSISGNEIIQHTENSSAISGVRLYRAKDRSEYKHTPSVVLLNDFVFSLKEAYYRNSPPPNQVPEIYAPQQVN